MDVAKKQQEELRKDEEANSGEDEASVSQSKTGERFRLSSAAGSSLGSDEEWEDDDDEGEEPLYDAAVRKQQSIVVICEEF